MNKLTPAATVVGAFTAAAYAVNSIGGDSHAGTIYPGPEAPPAFTLTVATSTTSSSFGIYVFVPRTADTILDQEVIIGDQRLAEQIVAKNGGEIEHT